MKLLAPLAVLMLSGCMSYGSWLQEVGKLPDPPHAMSNEQAAALGAEITRLRGQAEAMRVRLASEADRVQRFRYYDELRSIGGQLQPLETQLRNAGRTAGPPLAPA
jgi:hypothetical protein